MANVKESETSRVPDNEENRLTNGGYVGVSPEYQNAASVQNRPYDAEGGVRQLVEEQQREAIAAVEDQNVSRGDLIVQPGLGVPTSPVDVKQSAVLPSADRAPVDSEENKKLAKEIRTSQERVQEQQAKANAERREALEADATRIEQMRAAMVGAAAAGTDVSEGKALTKVSDAPQVGEKVEQQESTDTRGADQGGDTPVAPSGEGDNQQSAEGTGSQSSDEGNGGSPAKP